MNSKMLILPFVALALCAFNQFDNKVDNQAKAASTQMENKPVVIPAKVDNTGINVRDRDHATLTPGNQLENKTDLSITQEARELIVKDSSLSTNAKNIKIITQNAVVTLRGPVDNMAEKAAIDQKVKSVQGVVKVDNQLDVKQ